MADDTLDIPVDESGRHWLTVEVDPEDGVDLASNGARGWRRPSFNLVTAMDNVMPALDVIINRVRDGRVAPDEVTLELGLKIGGEHGVILTKGTAEANLKVTVKWLADPSRPTAPEVEVAEESDGSPG